MEWKPRSVATLSALRVDARMDDSEARQSRLMPAT
jgi:hypothetical protein